MANGASRFFMPAVPEHVFVRAVDAVVRASAQWVSPHGKGALYVRPLLMGTGEGLGVKPSTWYRNNFLCLASPVGNYFRSASDSFSSCQGVQPGCSWRIGVHFKASGNYAPAFLVQ
jgi:branched-chain amino acid aminotransferase